MALVFGVCTVFTYKRTGSDWGLLSAFGGLFIALFWGAILSVVFSALAFVRKESKAKATLLLSLPALFFFGSSQILVGKRAFESALIDGMVGGERESARALSEIVGAG